MNFQVLGDEVGSQNGAKLELKWEQKSTPAKIHKNQLNTSPLSPNWLRSTQDGIKNRSKFDQKLNSKMECLLASIFVRFWWIWEAKLDQKIDQNTIQKDIKKSIDFCIDFWSILEPFWAHLGRQDGAQIAPRGTQDTPERLPQPPSSAFGRPKSILIDFSSIFGRFVNRFGVDVWSIFDRLFNRFLVEFWSIFDWFFDRWLVETDSHTLTNRS